MFFMNSILVPPLTIRPTHAFQQQVFAHHQTLMFSAVLLQKRKMEVILERMEASDLSELNKDSQVSNFNFFFIIDFRIFVKSKH